MESRLNPSHYNQAYAHSQRIPMNGQPRRCFLPTPTHPPNTLTSPQNYPFQQKFPHPPINNPSTSTNYPTPLSHNPQNTVNPSPNYLYQKEFPRSPLNNPSTSTNYPTPLSHHPQNTVNSTPNYSFQKEFPRSPSNSPSPPTNHPPPPPCNHHDLPEGFQRIPSKNYVLCTICNSKIRPDVINIHTATIDHIANGKNVIHRLDDRAFKCIICNIVLINHKKLQSHLKDRDHKMRRSHELDPKLRELKKSYPLPEAIVRSDVDDNFWCTVCNIRLKGDKVSAEFHASRRVHRDNMVRREGTKNPEFGLSRDGNQMIKPSTSYQSNPPSSSSRPSTSSSAIQRDGNEIINWNRKNYFPSAPSPPKPDLDNFLCEICNIIITGGYWNIIDHRKSNEHKEKMGNNSSESNSVFNQRILPEGIEYIPRERFLICIICLEKIYPGNSITEHLSREVHRSSRKFFTRLSDKKFNCDICNCTLTSWERLLRHASRELHNKKKSLYMNGEPLPIPSKPNYWLKKSLNAMEHLPEGIEKFPINTGGIHWLCTICNCEFGYYSRVDEHVAGAAHKANGKKVIFRIDEMSFKCLICHKYLMDYVQVKEHLREKSHCERSRMIEGSGGHVNQYFDNVANQSDNQRVNEVVDRRDNQYVNQYVREHVNPHFNEGVHRHVNEHVNPHNNEHLNSHDNQRIHPHFNPNVDNHVNQRVDNHSNEHVNPHFNEVIHRHVNEHLNPPDNQRVHPHFNPNVDNHVNQRVDNHTNEHVNPYINERKRRISTNEYPRKNYEQDKSRIERDIYDSEQHFATNEFSIDDFIVRDECYGSEEDGEGHYDNRNKRIKLVDDLKSKRRGYREKRQNEIMRIKLNESLRKKQVMRSKSNHHDPVDLQPGIIQLAGEASFLCIFCNSSFLPNDAVSHFKNVEHRDKMEKIITRMNRDTYKCILCRVKLLLKEVNEHLQGRNHLKNRALKESKANDGVGLSEMELEIAWKKMKNLKKGDSDDEWDWSTI